MSEEQLKAADADATKEEEEEVEEISEDELEGVAGGAIFTGKDLLRTGGEDPTTPNVTCCGHDPCLGPEAGCNSETTTD